MRQTTKDRLIPAALIALSLVPALAGAARVAEVAGGAAITPDNARFLAAPLPVLLHLPAVIVYSMVGAFQFSPGFRRRNRRWHRAAGWVLAPAGLVSALTGLWMAQTYAWPAGDGLMVYAERLVFGAAMVAFLVLGLEAIRQRDFAAHGAWMTRAYAIGLGAGTQVLTHLPWFLLVDGWPGETARGVMMGSAWVINLAVAEWVIRRGARARTTSFRHSRHDAPHEGRDDRDGREGHGPGRRAAA